MSKLVVQQEPVFCLHVRKYRETSAILDCLSQNHGRINLIAKGVYRAKNSFDVPSYFQAYTLSGIIRSELGILTDLELKFPWPKLVGKKWYVACYLNELLLKLLPKQESVPVLYECYAKTLHALAGEEDYQFALIVFEKRLLETLGYGINLHTDSRDTQSLDSESFYRYHPVHGFIVSQASEDGSISGTAINALACEDEDLFSSNKNILTQAKHVVRMALKQQLAGVQLKTVQVLNDVNSFTINE